MNAYRTVRTLAVLALLGLLACLDPLGPEGGRPGGGGPVVLDSADLRVVFVGNSLTYVNDVPALVQALADAAGRSMAHVTLASPNFSLQDHWYAGVPDLLREVRADVVVMQQGPSSLPESQTHLAQWTVQMAGVIREAGGEPALYMVWPDRTRMAAFPDVWDAYLGAAQMVNGLFIPAGQTWVEGWAIDSSLPLYGGDGFHQSPLGALAAAQTIYAVLFDVPADSVPTIEIAAPDGALDVLPMALERSLERADSAMAMGGGPIG